MKYTPEYGKVVMTITEIEPEKEGCATFRTVIGDSGTGMKQEYLEHILNPFPEKKHLRNPVSSEPDLVFPL